MAEIIYVVAKHSKTIKLSSWFHFHLSDRIQNRLQDKPFYSILTDKQIFLYTLEKSVKYVSTCEKDSRSLPRQQGTKLILFDSNLITIFLYEIFKS